MKKSTKAALLSGLVFPGIGHMVLKKYLRGSILMVPTLVALSIVVIVAARQALAVVDSLNSGEIPADTEAIKELISNPVGGADDLTVTASFIVILACWLIGIFDSYRLGRIRDTRQARD